MYEAAEVFGLIPGFEHTEMHDMLQAKIIKGAAPEARVFYTSQGKSSNSDPTHFTPFGKGAYNFYFTIFSANVVSSSQLCICVAGCFFHFQL